MDVRPILSTLRKHKVTTWLLVIEIALTCAIVCNTVFLIGQRMQRMHTPSGIAGHQVVELELAYIGHRPDADARAKIDLAALRRIPGVKQVALMNALPFSGSSSNGGVKTSSRQQRPTVNATQYLGENVIPTLGVRLVEGRAFASDEYIDLDTALAALQSGNLKGLPQNVIISRALADRLWPGQEALGKSIYLGNNIPFRVVGVLARLARPNMLSMGAQYSMLLPITMNMGQGAMYVLRCAPQDRVRVLRAALDKLKQIDPNRVVIEKRTWDDVREAYFKDDRAMTGMLVGVIVALLTVTALGIVGLASFWVAQRRRMIGVRRALGATRGNILRYFQTENFIIVTLGIVLGMVLAFGLNLLLMQHYEMPRLPFFYLPVGAAVLWGLGQLAVLAPALRAANVPPVVATRSV